MTGAARRDVASIRTSAGRVTDKTSQVCVQSRRNRQPNTVAVSPMTSGAAGAFVGMCGVIESDIETLQRRKWFDLSCLGVCMTNRADLALIIRKLLLMTASARRVCGFA